MRKEFILISMLMCAVIPAEAGVSFSIGIDLQQYPELVPVPGYPVYYAPDMDSNYFFYDGMYWVYADDNWYQSAWYNGPWDLVDPEFVPLYVLRVPVRFYRQPPLYFHGWSTEAPPHWDEHWGNNWSHHHIGWDHWQHNAAPARAPLPVYQRQYTGNQYPQRSQQQRLQHNNYQYQPHHTTVPASEAQHQHSAPLFVRPAKPAPSNNVESHGNEFHGNNHDSNLPSAQRHMPVPHPEVSPQVRQNMPTFKPRQQANDAPREQRTQSPPSPAATHQNIPTPRPESKPAPRHEHESEQNGDHHGGDDHDHR